MRHPRFLNTAVFLLSGFTVVFLPLAVQAQSSVTPHAAQSSTMMQNGRNKETERKLRIWTWSLSQIAAREKANLFVDVSLDSTPPYAGYDKPCGVAAMKALARAVKRTWKQIDGIQTFSRMGVWSQKEEIAAALSWVNSLTPEHFSELMGGTITLDQLDESQQDLMQSLNGWEPDMNFALLGKSQTQQIRLTLSPKVQYRDPQTGELKTISLPCRPERALSGKAAKPSEPTHALGSPEVGELDFGKGVTLSLTNIVDKAQKAYSVRYIVDERVANTWYFVSGRYSRKGFEQALANVSMVPPVRLMQTARSDRHGDLAALRERLKGEGKQKLDVTRLRDNIQKRGSDDIDLLNQKYGKKEEMESEDFLQGKTVRCSDLCQGKPGLTAYFENNGLKPDTLLTLSADFVLAIQSEGKHLMSNGYSEVDGQPVPTYALNETLIGLEE